MGQAVRISKCPKIAHILESSMRGQGHKAQPWASNSQTQAPDSQNQFQGHKAQPWASDG